MPRHVLRHLPRGATTYRTGAPGGQRGLGEDVDWSTVDRVQVLGDNSLPTGHTGCVNALSWSEDGGILLSGSDDTRVCIWTPDSDASGSSSPHPMKLSTSILTGHRANIFSAKFLPNAGTPTIVSVAGDHEIRLLEIDRLSPSERPGSDLSAHGGTGVKVLRCHRDMTKKIATENSPFLFMTVSEDRTVRQHDLRRPHRCRSECPDPLFRAPPGVDLYSLSVSTVTPHMFAVAGRADTAFVCDRRMLEKHTPSWGDNIVGSGQVHCVRRLGLSDEEWASMEPQGERRILGKERHITCVKMSQEHADEAIVAFQGHSTALFSTHDSPGPSSARQTPGAMLSPGKRTQASFLPDDPIVSQARDRPSPRRRARMGVGMKRNVSAQEDGRDPARLSTGSVRHPEAIDVRDGTAGPGHAEDSSAGGRFDGPTILDRPSPNLPPELDPNIIARLQEERLRDLLDLAEDGDGSEDDDMHSDDDERSFAYDARPGDLPTAFSFEDGPVVGRVYPDSQIDETNDDDGDDYYYDDEIDDLNDNEDEDEYMHQGWEDEDDGNFDDEDIEDEDVYTGPGHALWRSADSEFGGVDMITPRRTFKGAKNIETVKDCNFLGLRSDKVCSGSDDGHFFVWDKDTGRLEGIWEGDGSIVNVMEQHPTLPLVAVSGIDSTIKMFAATMNTLNPSFNRTHLQETIIRANTAPDLRYPASALGSMRALRMFLAQPRSRLMYPDIGDEGEDPAAVRPDCQTQ